MRSETGAGDDHHFGTMKQAIESGSGQRRIAQQHPEGTHPLFQCSVAGQHYAAPLVPLVDQIVQVIGRRRLRGLQAKGEDQQIGAEGFYNQRRLHSSLDYESPETYDQLYHNRHELRLTSCP